MKTILYMACSITGKTTSRDSDTSWVESSDVERLDALMVDCGVMIMGKATYESFGVELPKGKALLVVMTHDHNLLKKNQDGLIFTDMSPKKVLSMLTEKGFKKVMLAGGETLNSTFLNDELVNEIRIIVKPILIGQGKSLFNTPIDVNLKLLTTTPLSNSSIELVYEVINN